MWRDRSLDVLVKGYPALGDLRRSGARRPGEDGSAPASGVDTPLLGRKALVVGGPAGVRLFYDRTLTTRQKALPAPVRSVLFGDGAVHGLDGGAHRHRKALFLSLLDVKAAEELAAAAYRHWQAAATRWTTRGGPFDLFDESVAVLGAAVCAWAGVPPDRCAPGRYRDMATIVDGFGSVGPRHLAARRARRRADRWAGELIEDVRAGRIAVPSSAPLKVIAAWRDEDGRRLDVPVAAVELLNVLRPATAVAWFVTAAALALADAPAWRTRLREERSREAVAGFAHEVRRLYPFAPMLAAVARTDFDWHGHTVAAGERIVLDLYGTLHDETAWPDPERFDPERFIGDAGAAAFSDAYVPHGGGDPVEGHRCPGEPATVALIEGAVRHLVSLRFRLEDQRPPRLNRMPPHPRAVLNDVHVDPATPTDVPEEKALRHDAGGSGVG